MRDAPTSQFLSAGVQRGRLSQQLGHADVAVMAKHSARWAGGDFYCEPLYVQPGDVPADLLAYLERSDSGRSAETNDAPVREGAVEK